MRRILIGITAAVMAAWLVTVAGSAWGQETEEKTSGGAPARNAPKLATGYRVEFVIRELEDGKRVNARNYVMLIESDTPGYTKLRVGSRISYATAVDQFQLQDVGMNIDCRLVQQPDSSLELVTSIDWSSLAPYEGTGGRPDRPVVRQLKFAGNSLIPAAKPTMIGTMDDVASNHHYEIEVTATKVK